MAGIRLIVGLGNPGKEYEHTRHNAGYDFVNRLVGKTDVAWSLDHQCLGLRAQLRCAHQSFWVFRPSRYMNQSGRPVVSTLSVLNISPEQLLVVHDDLDLQPGTVRLKFDGGHGGQNGLRDIMGLLGHGAFHRLRIGIGHPGHKRHVVDWVLSQPDKQDALAIAVAMELALDTLPMLLVGQFSAAMHKLHTQT